MQMQVNSEKIRRWREERCWSQEHLAEVSGISLRTVQRLENGGSTDLGTDPVFSPSNDNRRSAPVKTGSVPMLDDILPEAPILESN